MTAHHNTVATRGKGPDDRAFLGHPKGLGYLALVEGGERFSYYSMQALLTLYMYKYRCCLNISAG